MLKSICFIAGGLAGGGQERALTNLANEFASRGHQISIICLYKTEVFFELHKDIKVVWPTADRTTTNKFLYAFKLIPYIRKNIVHINPSTIVSFGDWFNAYSILSTRFLNKPIYITNRMGPNLYLGKFLEFFNKATYKMASGMIVQTERAKDIMRNKYGITSISVVPNAVKPVVLPVRSPEKSIITVGRLSKEKGHEVLIKAFAQLKDKTWKLDIVGDGPKRAYLEDLVHSLDLKARVHFHGHQKDFKHILGKASLFVLPSYYEGFPNALVEAMSVPIACVSSDCVAGPGEIIKHGKNGYLFEPGNDHALSLILNQLTSDPSKLSEIEKNAYEVVSEFDFQTVASQFLHEILK